MTFNQEKRVSRVQKHYFNTNILTDVPILSEFPSCDVRKAMETILEQHFTEETTYTPQLNAICVKLCEEIKYRCAKLDGLFILRVV